MILALAALVLASNVGGLVVAMRLHRRRAAIWRLADRAPVGEWS